MTQHEKERVRELFVQWQKQCEEDCYLPIVLIRMHEWEKYDFSILRAGNYPDSLLKKFLIEVANSIP